MRQPECRATTPSVMLRQATLANPPQRELADRMRRAGFAKVAWRNMTLGVVALHSGWRI